MLFANFAEAMAEGRGKAQADTLRKATHRDGRQSRLIEGGRTEAVPAGSCARATSSSCAAGEFIPGDGEIIEGVASVDESAITGESAPVIRESGGDRSRGDRRHARAVGPDQDPHHVRTPATPSSIA